MEKHKCKLCFRNFSNGRALGGHMRSHVMNHTKPNESPPTCQLSFEAESSSTPSSGEEQEDNNGLGYGLRENPKRSFRLADPEFSFAAPADTGSVIVQDRESETESNVTRRRSNRDWKLGEFSKKIKLSQHGNRNESESSASDITTEEDVAFCLMLLSRDLSSSSRDTNWRRQNRKNTEQEPEEQEQEDQEQEDEEEDDLDLEEDEEEEEEESDEYEELKNKTKTNKVRGGRYKCETCDRVFRSYQALGGHRASHKKIKLENNFPSKSMEIDNDNDDEKINVHINNSKKIHECPVCFRVFASGQALGGHKRTHVVTSVPATAVTRAAAAVAVVANSNIATSSSTKLGRESLIDLNLPAPVDDEDSAVSDAECFKPAVKVFPR